MKYLVILLLLNAFLLKGQQNVVGIFQYNKSEKSEEGLKNKLIEIRNQLNYCKENSCRARVYHALGSIYYFLDNTDSVRYCLEQAYAFDPLWVCRYSKIFHELDSNSYTMVYYASKFSDTWWAYHQARCRILCGDCSKKNTKEEADINPFKNREYQERLIEIGERDQKFREKDFEKQKTLDSINRNVLDSLYNIYGFPSNEIVSEKCQYNLWLTIHHSTDCDWTKIWIDRYLEAVEDRKIGGYFLENTIKRFYSPENGYCKKDSKVFIEYLKNKYSKEFSKTFGYETF
jgi:hypothetical protein